MITILNPWKSKEDRLDTYEVDKNHPVATRGDLKIYRQFGDNYLYTFKNIAIGCLAGINEKLLDQLVTENVPELNSPQYFLFIRMKETMYKGIALANRLQFKIQ